MTLQIPSLDTHFAVQWLAQEAFTSRELGKEDTLL